MTSSRLRWWVAFLFALVLQLWGLYSPSQPGPPLPLHADKVIHAAMFALVAFTARGLGVRAWVVIAALVAHAGLSEVIQARLLADRSGDLFDVVADIVGTLLGGWLFTRWDRRSDAAHRAP